MRVFLNTTALLMVGSSLVSGWRFAWDMDAVSDTRDQPFCMSISHRSDCRDNPNSIKCNKPRDPTWYQWERDYQYSSTNQEPSPPKWAPASANKDPSPNDRRGCRLTLYSDTNCETGRANLYWETVDKSVSSRTSGNWDIKAYKVDNCDNNGGNGPPHDDPPNNGPPNNGPKCYWEEGKRGERGHCEGGRECRGKSQRECGRRN